MSYVHTFIDADVIDGAPDAILRQTRPADDILLVDNASTDGTLHRTFPERVTIIRNAENLGSCGAVRIGLSHALEHGFDWMRLLDADSVPAPDALERLIDLYNGFPNAQKQETGVIACLPEDRHQATASWSPAHPSRTGRTRHPREPMGILLLLPVH